MAHELAVTVTYADGHVDTWTSTQSGAAAEAHASLAKRWRAAGYDFDRDRAALTLTRRRPALGELGASTEVVQHRDIESTEGES